MNTRNIRVEGIIIKRRNIAEADRLVTLFTKSLGKIQIKAAGVRRITSRRSSHMELLNQGVFTLYKGKGMPILTEVETIADFSSLKEHLTKIGFGYHICELIDGLCPENQENSIIFTLLEKTLHRLSSLEEISVVIHDFEIQLLTHLGFFPERNIATINTTSFIESILERKLKSRQIIPQLQ